MHLIREIRQRSNVENSHWSSSLLGPPDLHPTRCSLLPPVRLFLELQINARPLPTTVCRQRILHPTRNRKIHSTNVNSVTLLQATSPLLDCSSLQPFHDTRPLAINHIFLHQLLRRPEATTTPQSLPSVPHRTSDASALIQFIQHLSFYYDTIVA